MPRPKKTPDNEKKNKITVRFTDDEMEVIREEAGQADMTLSEYIREQIYHGKIVVNYCTETSDESAMALAEEYHKIGINLNQIAHHLNAAEIPAEMVLSDIADCVDKLHELNARINR